jgi:hypothetical protein
MRKMEHLIGQHVRQVFSVERLVMVKVRDRGLRSGRVDQWHRVKGIIIASVV